MEKEKALRKVERRGVAFFRTDVYKKFKDDEDIILAATEHDYIYILFASERLQNDKGFLGKVFGMENYNFDNAMPMLNRLYSNFFEFDYEGQIDINHNRPITYNNSNKRRKNSDRMEKTKRYILEQYNKRGEIFRYFLKIDWDQFSINLRRDLEIIELRRKYTRGDSLFNKRWVEGKEADDEERILNLVVEKNDREQFLFASDRLRNNLEFISELIEKTNNPFLIEYAGEEVRENTGFRKEIARKYSKYNFDEERYQNDFEYAKAWNERACHNVGLLIENYLFLPEPLKRNSKVRKTACYNYDIDKLLEHIKEPNEFKNLMFDREWLYKYFFEFPEHLQTQPEILDLFKQSFINTKRYGFRYTDYVPEGQSYEWLVVKRKDKKIKKPKPKPQILYSKEVTNLTKLLRRKTDLTLDKKDIEELYIAFKDLVLKKEKTAKRSNNDEREEK